MITKTGNKASTKVDLNDEVWKVPMNGDLVTQVINVYLDNQRKGTAHAKTRGEVRGGGKKPWRQKGTGRARHGSIRSPLWRKGGVAFGPRTYKKYKRIPKKMNNLALKCVLSHMVSGDNFRVVDSLGFGSDKLTTKAADFLSKVGFKKGLTIIMLSSGESKDKETAKAISNLKNVEVRSARDLNVYDVVNAKNMIVSKSSIKEVEERLS